MKTRDKVLLGVSLGIVLLGVLFTIVILIRDSGIRYGPTGMFENNSLIKEEINGIKIEYEYIGEEEINLSRSFVKDLDSLFTTEVKKIIFTNSVAHLCKGVKECRWLCVDGECCGLNYPRKGKIYVSWNSYYTPRNGGRCNTIEEVKETLCHEVLHYTISTKNSGFSDIGHRRIMSLEKKLVCFK